MKTIDRVELGKRILKYLAKSRYQIIVFLDEENITYSSHRRLGKITAFSASKFTNKDFQALRHVLSYQCYCENINYDKLMRLFAEDYVRHHGYMQGKLEINGHVLIHAKSLEELDFKLSMRGF